MRKARIRAEVDQNLLIEKNRADKVEKDTLVTERFTANHFYSNYNKNFDLNENRYTDRLGKSIRKQDKIVELSLSPNTKFKTFSLET